ncbi:hypothetical protein [Stackebrandtia nassauensis]|uniref:Uncharacterized protein n=1 Tax=Stackebrandtia nassauensis (strain DSM 44728 / CIP 108903 / NRRL B-16338 / NBRC 102104 / LLR-40K-21) TaxID=446470 RepID=D3Q2P7_STANL|nr:hypothetical protein [Stackebrandtia nassauensis]ADD45798.1 hypothetical protein Snas_6175 [Stackebrandtia nassauensis DSM 44728]
MRTLGKLIGLSAFAMTLAIPAAAQAAAANLVDGTVATSGTNCSWTNAATSDNPPNTLTIDQASVSVTCDDGTPITLNNSPQVTFDDGAGTATVDKLNITGTKSGISCTYEATGVQFARTGDTRDYTGGPISAGKTDGSILCPGTMTLDSAAVSFH